MPLPVIAGVVRCAVRGVCPSGAPWVNVHHFRYSDGASAPGPTEIATLDVQLDKLYGGPAYSGGTAWLAFCRPNCTMIDITYTPLDGPPPSLSIVTAHSHSGGSVNPNSAPSEVSLVCTLRTAKRGRRYRGRIYLPPFDNTVFSADGTITTAGTTGLLAQYNGMKSALVAGLWKPVVASYGKSLVNDPSDPHDKIEVTWTPFATDVANPTMDTKFDVQRRRK